MPTILLELNLLQVVEVVLTVFLVWITLNFLSGSKHR